MTDRGHRDRARPQVAVAAPDDGPVRHLQALRRRRRADRRLVRGAAGRGPRAARRERRRQVDADERRLRRHAPGRRHDRRSTASRSSASTPAVAQPSSASRSSTSTRRVLPDMTVAENIRVAVPPDILGSAGDERGVRCAGSSTTSASRPTSRTASASLSVAQKHLLELAKALAVAAEAADPRRADGAPRPGLGRAALRRVRPRRAAHGHGGRLHHPPPRPRSARSPTA